MKAKSLDCLRKLQTNGLITLLLYGVSLGCFAQSNAPVDIVWDRTYGGERDDFASKVLPLKDGGFLLAGNSNSGAGHDKSDPSRGLNDVWLVRVD